MDWTDELDEWLSPFLHRLGHKARRTMCPLYVSGLIGPGERKSMEPIAERVAAGHYDRLHHFISDGLWDASALETELARAADRLVGGNEAMLLEYQTEVTPGNYDPLHPSNAGTDVIRDAFRAAIAGLQTRGRQV